MTGWSEGLARVVFATGVLLLVVALGGTLWLATSRSPRLTLQETLQEAELVPQATALVPTHTPTTVPTTPAATATPTPRATRSTYPFACEVTIKANLYDSPWTGVAGYVRDLIGNPLPGYYARVECPGVGVFNLGAGEVERYNLMYGSDAAWEQACNPIAYQAMEIRFQLFNNRPSADGPYRAVSEQMTVDLGASADQSLGFVVCTLNWEEWQPTPAVRPTPVVTSDAARMSPIPSPRGTPLPTPSPGGGPSPTMLVESEWPSSMEVDRADTLRVSLVREPEGLSASVAGLPGHDSPVATLVPLGTPGVPLEEAFGTGYTASVFARLDAAAFRCSPSEAQYQPLDQPRADWVWNCVAENPGRQSVDVSISVRFEPAEPDGGPTDRQVWRSRLEISVHQPWIDRGQLSLLGILGALLTSMISVPWLYARLREAIERRQRGDGRSQVRPVHQTSGYGRVAARAVGLFTAGAARSPRDAWLAASGEVFGWGTPSQAKGCPRDAFLGLCEEGLIKGIPAGTYTRSRKNKQYAVDAVAILRRNPRLAADPRALWSAATRGERKTHNSQMDVVAALWNSGLLVDEP